MIIIFFYLQNLPPHIKDLITRLKNRNANTPYPTLLKSFAKTLYFHSPAAYDVVRRLFLNCLPCPKTLNKWAGSLNHETGISIEVLKHVPNLISEEKKKGKK